MEGSPALTAQVYGFAYTGDILFQPGDNIETTTLASGEFELSTNFVSVNIQNGACTAATDSQLSIGATSRSRNLEGLVYLTADGIIPASAISKENGISVYPNPTTGQISVNISQLGLTGNANIIVSDVSGKQLINQKVDGNNPTIRMDVSSIQNGLYFISIHSEGKKVTTMKVPLVKLN